jgi:ornithine cyclodeaminase/alanine dehydrogenase-like protein (mu-crystallin family)
MLLLSNHDVEQVLNVKECISVVEEGIRDLGSGQALDTGRSDVYTSTTQEGLFHRLAVLRGTNKRAQVMSLRLMSDMTSWTEKQTEDKYCTKPGLFCGLIMLFSTETGEPLAIMHDGVLQHLSVGAGAGVGAKYLSKRDSSSLGVLGSGGQARSITEAVFAVRQIKKVKVFSPTPAHRDDFARWVQRKFNVSCEAENHPRAVFDSDIVITATNSVQEPVFEAQWVEPGTHLTYVNYDEVAGKIFGTADIVCSMLPNNPESTPVKAPMNLAHGFAAWAIANEQQLKRIPRRPKHPVPEDRAAAIGDVLLGHHKGRADDSQITICGAGGGQRITIVGGMVFQLAKAAGLGREIPTEWFLQDVRD